MNRKESSTARVRLVAVDPPFLAEQGVLFGLQDKHGVVDAVPATSTTDFDTELELIGVGTDGQDYSGEHVHGRKDDRFLYLSWGNAEKVEPFVMFARAKIKLADIPIELLQAVADGGIDLECRVQATNAKGQPASGTIKSPAASWRRHR